MSKAHAIPLCATMMIAGVTTSAGGAGTSLRPPGGPHATGLSATSPEFVRLETVGQIGGGITALWLEPGLAYVGVGARLAVLDVSDSGQPEELGRSDLLPGLVSGVVVTGDRAYVALGGAGLGIMDVSIPSTPRHVDTWRAVRTASSLDLTGHPQHLAVGGDGMSVIDVSDPDHPRLVASVPSVDAQATSRVRVQSGRAYLLEGPYLLRSIDLADPSQPRELGRLDLSPTLYSLTLDVSDGHVFLAAGDSGVGIVDASNPAEMRLAATFNEMGADSVGLLSVNDVSVSGSHALLTGRDVVALDVTVPEEPRRVGLLPIETSGLAVAGNTAFAMDGRWGGATLHVLDVSDPAGMHPVGTVSPDPPGSMLISGEVCGSHLALEQGVAFVAGGFDVGLWIVDATEPGRLATLYHDPELSVSRVAVDGRYAFVFDALNASLVALDVRDPKSPALLGSLFTGSRAPIDMAAASGYVYVTYDDSLVAYDVSDPARMKVAATVGFGQSGEPRMVVEGGLAYVVAGAAPLNLVVLDTTRPALPEVSRLPLVQLEQDDAALDLVVTGGRAYVLGPGALRVLDVSDPYGLRELGIVPARGWTLQVADGRAYVGHDAIDIYDVSRPSALTPLGEGHPLVDETIIDMVVVAETAFALGSLGLHALDLRDALGGPIEIGAYASAPGGVGQAEADDDHLFLTDGDRLWSYDMSRPDRPVELGSTPVTGRLRVVGDHAYLLGPWPTMWLEGRQCRGLCIVDVSDPSDMAQIARLDVRGDQGDFYVEGRTAYVVAGGAGTFVLTLVDVSDAGHPVITGSAISERVSDEYVPLISPRIDVSEGVAYVVDDPTYRGDARLSVFDVSDVRAPALSCTLALPAEGTPIDIAAGHGAAHILVRELVDQSRAPWLYRHRLLVADVTGACPLVVAELPLASNYSTLTLFDDRLIAAGDGRLLVIDVDDPAHPRGIGSTTIPGSPGDIAVRQDLVFAAAGSGGAYALRMQAAGNTARAYLPISASDGRGLSGLR